DEDDEIYGYAGNDTIVGGKGNDMLYGADGNDTYIFNLGDGNDTIDEYNTSSSSDRIVFGEGITVEDITISRENDDIIIHIGDNGDSIRICDFYYRAWGNDYRVEVFEFTDGNVSSIDCVQILNLNEYLQAA
ncbi:MAG: hemolysin, partial [Ruminococcus sp.]|nr:hemolysin [Ruminococcus sp.]